MPVCQRQRPALAAHAAGAPPGRNRDRADLGNPSMSMWRWLAPLLRNAWQRLSSEPAPAERLPGPPTARIEVVFSLSVLAFTLSALTVIVARAGGDHFSVLWFALAAGAFGASSSMARSQRCEVGAGSEAAVPREPTWPLLVLRTAVGCAAAYLFYVLARLGILAGGPFPDLAGMGDPASRSAAPMQGLSVADFAKLMLGCFVAGFAERLLGSIRPRPADRS